MSGRCHYGCLCKSSRRYFSVAGTRNQDILSKIAVDMVEHDIGREIHPYCPNLGDFHQETDCVTQSFTYQQGQDDYRQGENPLS